MNKWWEHLFQSSAVILYTSTHGGPLLVQSECLVWTNCCAVSLNLLITLLYLEIFVVLLILLTQRTFKTSIQTYCKGKCRAKLHIYALKQVSVFVSPSKICGDITTQKEELFHPVHLLFFPPLSLIFVSIEDWTCGRPAKMFGAPRTTLTSLFFFAKLSMKTPMLDGKKRGGV